MRAHTPPGFGGLRILGTYVDPQHYGAAPSPAAVGMAWEVVRYDDGFLTGLIAEPADLYEQGPGYPSVLEFPNFIRQAWIYHLDGHIYARAQAPSPGAPMFVVRVTDPARLATNRQWMVAQGWGDALAALQRIRPSVLAALPAKRSAFIEESVRLSLEQFWEKTGESLEDVYDVVEWLNNVPSRLAKGASSMASEAADMLETLGLILLGVGAVAAGTAIYVVTVKGS
jgi:hypothetical protein